MKTLKKVKKNFNFPSWYECTWRRVPCGKDSCKVCGKIKRDRERHIVAGEDPDDIKNVFKDMGENFRQVLEMLKRDMERLNIDISDVNKDDLSEPPEPEKFELHNKVKEWRDSIYKTVNDATENGGFWIFTEAGEDLRWYANTLVVKIYRQLCNRWYMNNDEEVDDGHDYAYTKYVLGESLKFLKNSLSGLLKIEMEQRGKLNLALLYLSGIENEILNI